MQEEDSLEFSAESPPALRLEDVTGLEDQKRELRRTLLQGATGEVDDTFRPVSGVVYGPPGSGKRRLLQATAGELGAHGYDLLRVSTLRQGRTGPPEYAEALFDAVPDMQPVTLVLDCMGDFIDDDVARTVVQRCDTARERGQDLVVLSPLESDSLHGGRPTFLRQVDLVVELERPDLKRRESVLGDRLGRAAESVPSLDPASFDLRRLARETDRFGVDDLDRLVRRLVAEVTSDGGIEPPVAEDDVVGLIERVDAERVERLVDEETLTDVDVPEVTFEDVGGHERAKRRLLEQTERALSPDDAAGFGVDPAGGVLLHGPPGTGKTMLVRALANELDYTFIPVNSSILQGGRTGPAELIPGLFYRAQRNAPAVLFFDEFDLLGTRRGPTGDDTAVNTLLTELDGVERLDGVMVIAATNRPETLDPALLRPGRFDYHLEIGRPDESVQAEIFETHTADVPTAPDVTPEWFAGTTDTVTGADVAAICERAVTIGLRDQNPDELRLSRAEFERAHEEFQRGRLPDDDPEDTPTFQ